jgi:hypothetical protein
MSEQPGETIGTIVQGVDDALAYEVLAGRWWEKTQKEEYKFQDLPRILERDTPDGPCGAALQEIVKAACAGDKDARIYLFFRSTAALIRHTTNTDKEALHEEWFAYSQDFLGRLNLPAARTKPSRVGSVLRLPDALPHYTFAEAREVHRAIGDGPVLKHWAGVEGEIALRHALPGEPLQTKFAPSVRLSEFRRWAGANLDAATDEHLRKELQHLSFDANMLFGVSLALCIDRNTFTATLDELAAAISWQPKSVAERQENRLKIWTWLLLFDSLRVIGLRKGSYKDGDGARRDLTSDDDLMHIAGTRGETTLDGIPHEVSLTVGPWVGKLRGDKQVLTYLGNLRTLASKPRGQLAQRLAVKTGIGLEQLWREKAAHHQTQVKRVGNENRISVQFEPFTRRQLLTTYGQGMAQEVEEALGGDHPGRIRLAWQQVIPLLKEWRIVGHYKELDPMPAERKNWDTFWYEEQRLDVRPAPLMADDVAEVNRAKAAADKARKRAKAANNAKK